MRVTWFILLFLQIQCKKKQFLIQTENEDSRNLSEKQSKAKVESKIVTIIEGNSKNKSKNLAKVKRAKQKGKDYWSDESYGEYNEYDEYHYNKNDQPFYNSYGNDQHFYNSYGNDQHFDNSYGNDQHFDNFFDNHIGHHRCGGNSRKGRNHRYELRLNEALHLDCGSGGCVGSVMFSSCRTRNKFERFSAPS